MSQLKSLWYSFHFTFRHAMQCSNPNCKIPSQSPYIDQAYSVTGLLTIAAAMKRLRNQGREEYPYVCTFQVTHMVDQLCLACELSAEGCLFHTCCYVKHTFFLMPTEELFENPPPYQADKKRHRKPESFYRNFDIKSTQVSCTSTKTEKNGEVRSLFRDTENPGLGKSVMNLLLASLMLQMHLCKA